MRNMLHAVLTLVLAGVLVVPGTAATQDRNAAAQGDSTALRRTVLAEREAIWRAWFTNDRAQLEILLPPHVIAINNGDSTWQDRTAVLASAAQFARDGGKLISLAFPRTKLQAWGDVAVLYSVFELEIEQGGKRTIQRGRATEIFHRRGGRWQNAGWHLDSGS